MEGNRPLLKCVGVKYVAGDLESKALKNGYGGIKNGAFEGYNGLIIKEKSLVSNAQMLPDFSINIPK